VTTCFESRRRVEMALSRGQQLPGEGIAAVWGGGDVACEIFIDEEAIHVPDAL